MSALAQLAARCREVGQVLAATLAAPPPPLPWAEAAPRRWLVTGVGASEGPARFLVHLLRRELDARARFAPLSAFLLEPDAPPADVLVVFSQGLSPNARLALERAGAYEAALLVTGLEPDEDAPPGAPARALADYRRRGLLVWRHPPASEEGLFLRVQGPAAATLAAYLLAERLAPPAGLHSGGPAALARALAAASSAAGEGHGAPTDEPLDPTCPLAFVGAGEGTAAVAHGLRWKFLEGLGSPEPPCWDALQIAHGPLQQFFPGPITLLALEPPGPAAGLFDRLASVLERPRHRLIRLRSPVPGPLAFFAFDALCNDLLLRSLARSTRDLSEWPARGRDGALYELGRAPGAA